MENLIDLNLYIDDINIENNIISNPLHLFFQEIELAIKIAPNELWGYVDSLDLNKYLFNQYVTTNQIKNEIDAFVTENCEHTKMFQYDIEVNLMNIENKDMIYIHFNVYDSINDKQFIAKFLLGN